MYFQDARLKEAIEVAKCRKVYFSSYRPEGSEFPELIVTVPDDWPYVEIAPLYDVHIGAARHDAVLFERHTKWLAESPYVLSFDGGDLIENANKNSVGAGVYEQDFNPDNQLVQALIKLAQLRHKMMFKLPGNHEARTSLAGIDVSRWMSFMADIEYFPDFCFCTIKYAGNNFRILAHHGAGGAQTAGGQLNAARKSISWAKPIDIYWTGHIHNPKADAIFQTDYDQKTNRIFERNGIVVVAPSYLKYFGTYAAQQAYSPGLRGLHTIQLQKDGRIDLSIHANGRRL